uniref:Uncharacterized protein LOC113795138 n=1 Tax=Dermatophagoides pteronyssinus TaxID=6956 RepID=A0A6P6Y6P3_DERPT|nr:uncharacterized protein LOC113795138 [Dermatophagoides pteronyssinus]
MDSSKQKSLTIKQQMLTNNVDDKHSNVMFINKTTIKNSKWPNDQQQQKMTPCHESSIAKNIKLDNNDLSNSNSKFRIDGTKSLTKFKSMTENYYDKMQSKTPACKKELKFACTAKYDPKMETGIPLIKPKPTTKIVPFKFATAERSTKRPK